MSPLRKIFASLLIVGTVTAGGVACGSSDDSSKSGDSAASTDAWCKRYGKFDETTDEEWESTGSDEEDMAAFTAEMEETIKQAEDLAKDAPEEIRDDMKMLAAMGRDMVSGDSEDEEAWAAFDEKYSDDKIEATTDRLEAFLKDTCGIDTDLEFGDVDFNDDGGGGVDSDGDGDEFDPDAN